MEPYKGYQEIIVDQVTLMFLLLGRSDPEE